MHSYKNGQTNIDDECHCYFGYAIDKQTHTHTHLYETIGSYIAGLSTINIVKMEFKAFSNAQTFSV